MDIGETAAPAPPVASDAEQPPECPVCGKPWTRTEPTLAQVRNAIREALASHQQALHAIEIRADCGYRGSVARGTVGNPKKSHYDFPPDIRGECGLGYDVDAFLLSGRLYRRVPPDRFRKRWARRDRELRGLEGQMRASLAARSELAHMKKGKAGFELLIRHHGEKNDLLSQGGVIMVILGA